MLSATVIIFARDRIIFWCSSVAAHTSEQYLSYSDIKISLNMQYLLILLISIVAFITAEESARQMVPESLGDANLRGNEELLSNNFVLNALTYVLGSKKYEFHFDYR